MKKLFCVLAVVALGGCSWEFYQNDQGGTSMRQKYPAGTPVYYQDGSYSHDMRYHGLRPEVHTLDEKTRAEQQTHDMHGIHWSDNQQNDQAKPQ